MRLEGTVAINAPRGLVWQTITDPEQVGQCAPGVERWSILEPGRKFQVIGALALGGSESRLRFPAVIEWLELDPPRRLSLTAEVQMSGSPVNVDSEMTLTPHPDGSTKLAFFIEISLPNHVAHFSRRLVANVAPKMTEQFFRCLKADLEA